MERYQEEGMLPVYDAGFISMDKQYLTVGVNGIVEAAEFLGYTIDNNPEYIGWLQKTLGTIYQANRESSKNYGVKYNCEVIPAESVGVKNAKWDKKDGYEVPRDCYNSYFYKVEDDSLPMTHKFVLHGEQVLQYLDGGSALHLNLEEYPSPEAAWKLLNLAAKTGCNYFCTNVKITICNECDNIDKRTLTQCPVCGSKNIDYGTRVIGYLKRVSSFSSDRQKEEALRHYHINK